MQSKKCIFATEKQQKRHNDEEVWYKFNQAVAKVRGWELHANVKVKKSKKS